jgi:hypothetical protein
VPQVIPQQPEVLPPLDCPISNRTCGLPLELENDPGPFRRMTEANPAHGLRQAPSGPAMRFDCQANAIVQFLAW